MSWWHPWQQINPLCHNNYPPKDDWDNKMRFFFPSKTSQTLRSQKKVRRNWSTCFCMYTMVGMRGQTLWRSQFERLEKKRRLNEILQLHVFFVTSPVYTCQQIDITSFLISIRIAFEPFLTPCFQLTSMISGWMFLMKAMTRRPETSRGDSI